MEQPEIVDVIWKLGGFGLRFGCLSAFLKWVCLIWSGFRV